MKPLLPLLLTSALVAADATPKPLAAPAPVKPGQAVEAPRPPGSSDDAIATLGRLPDPLALAQLNDFLATASSDDAGKVLMHIAITAARPARPAVVPMLNHRDPQVVDRALRALSSIGWTSTATREQIERLLMDSKPMVAHSAATCLGSGDDMRAVPALIDRLSKDPQEVKAASLTALQHLTQVDFKFDVPAWQAWYQSYRIEAAHRLAAQADLLDDPDTKKQIAGIQALAGMRGERQEAIDLIEPMMKSPDQTVAIAARQALATLAPNDYTMPTANEVVAATRPTLPVATKSDPGVLSALANRGFFDTWYGMTLTAFTGILVLSGVLFLLRTGPVKNATRRFGRVVVAGTVRFVRPLTSRIRKGTDRVVRSFTQSPKSNTGEKKSG